MKRQVVQDFLNLPGIVGIALIDERSHAHFLGIDQILNVQQKEILAQGIQQVVATTPAGLEFFSFQFVTHRIYIHKLEQAMILMVLTHPHLPQQDYQSTLTPLKQLLQTDEVDGAEAFSELVENIALDTELDPPAPPPVTLPPVESPLSAETEELPCYADVIDALNQLSIFTSHYLGKTMVSNTLKSSCPDIEWMQQFQVDRGGQIQWAPVLGKPKTEQLNLEQHQWIQSWASQFVKKCSRIILNYTLLLKRDGLSDRQKQILLPPNSGK